MKKYYVLPYKYTYVIPRVARLYSVSLSVRVNNSERIHVDHYRSCDGTNGGAASIDGVNSLRYPVVVLNSLEV